MPIMKCTVGTFRPAPSADVRWLVEEKDYGLAAESWRRGGYSLSAEEWHKANQELGFRYAALIQNQAVVSIAALIPYSSFAWEVGAIATDEPFQGRGYAKRVVSFVTAAILAEVPTATCTTRDTNEAMIRTAIGVGFVILGADEKQTYRSLIDEALSKMGGWRVFH